MNYEIYIVLQSLFIWNATLVIFDELLLATSVGLKLEMTFFSEFHILIISTGNLLHFLSFFLCLFSFWEAPSKITNSSSKCLHHLTPHPLVCETVCVIVLHTKMQAYGLIYQLSSFFKDGLRKFIYFNRTRTNGHLYNINIATM